MQRLDQAQASAFRKLTYAHFRSLLDALDPEHTIAIGESCFGQPVGLALARWCPNHEVAHVRSIFVKTPFRGRGLGTALLEALEDELQRCGFARVTAEYATPRPSTRTVECMLAKRGWDAPAPSYVIAHSPAIKIMKAPWLYDYDVPDDYRIIPWEAVQPEALEDIRQEQKHKPFVEEGLLPFPIGVPVDPETSLGLRHRGTLVGWMLTKRVAPGTLLYDRLYVRPEYRRLGRAVLLLAATIKRQYALEGHRPGCGGIWRTDASNRPMVAFIKRRLGPYLDSLTEVYRVEKNLC